MKKCIFCRSDIDEQAIICPVCKNYQKKRLQIDYVKIITKIDIKVKILLEYLVKNW